ncbi:unnamed protein product [Paramecium pentaurelia]|uniref:Uncharacterized protein n=1 Tax=Paramecium pentaurelia TaxID=43138 RepID=A0A8S1W1S5_9CILI|nr:unnamed protein product [Paramecium pentaurelia]
MDQENEDVNLAFPEYLTNKDEDEQMLDQCIQQFEKLQECQDKSIRNLIEAKLAVVINQTPISSVVSLYENLAAEYKISPKHHKVSKFFNQFPSMKIANDFIDGKIPQLPWPVIGALKAQELQDHLLKIFNFNYGRVGMHEFPFLWFPKLLKSYTFLLDNLFNTKTKILQDEKYYLAIMGAAASGCDQLYLLLSQIFYLNEGDRNWIDIGYDCVDEHIKQLDPLCKLLITKPWDPQLSQELHKLLKGKWRRKELVQALMIFIFYNNLGSFSLGNGIVKEIDAIIDNNSVNNSIQYAQHESLIDFIQNESILQELKQSALLEEDLPPEDAQMQIQIRQKTSQSYSFYVEDTDQQLKLHFDEKFSKHFSHSELQYCDSKSVLRSSEYSFQLNSYPVLKEAFLEGADAINNLLQEVKHMTRNSFGNEEVATTAFRKAIRYYGEGQFRYQHEDIDYWAQMEKLLPQQLKQFIKILIWTPNVISKSHIEQIQLQLSADELCHITLLTVAARIETQLIYLSKSLVEFM